MSKITNSTSQDIYWTINTLSIPANTTIITDSFPKGVAPVGITVDNAVGVYDPIIDSQLYSATTTYTVPTINNPYQIKLYCSAGTAQVQFNTTGKVMYMGIGMEMNFTCRERIIDTIKFTIASGTMIVVITKG
jgi:hypothetical protein